MLNSAPFTTAMSTAEDNLCLGLVIVTEHGRVSEALAQLEAHGAATIGEAQGHRIPICVFTRRKHDKDLLAELESLDGVMTVEVAYAHTIEEDEVK